MSNEKENNVTEPAAAEVGEQETPEAEAAPEPEEKDYRELYLRTLAELDNYGKRVERDREQGRLYAAENLMRSLLPVLDTLELAVGAAGEADDVCKGVQLALDDFLRILRDRGMEPIEALDQPFDPRYHEAARPAMALAAAPSSAAPSWLHCSSAALHSDESADRSTWHSESRCCNAWNEDSGCPNW